MSTAHLLQTITSIQQQIKEYNDNITGLTETLDNTRHTLYTTCQHEWNTEPIGLGLLTREPDAYCPICKITKLQRDVCMTGERHVWTLIDPASGLHKCCFCQRLHCYHEWVVDRCKTCHLCKHM